MEFVVACTGFDVPSLGKAATSDARCLLYCYFRGIKQCDNILSIIYFTALACPSVSVVSTCIHLNQLILFVQVEVNHASEIDAIFDSISYDKGASVIRMLQSYLGAERFQV